MQLTPLIFTFFVALVAAAPVAEPQRRPDCGPNPASVARAAEPQRRPDCGPNPAFDTRAADPQLSVPDGGSRTATAAFEVVARAADAQRVNPPGGPDGLVI
jgi:hypothetical protein